MYPRLMCLGLRRICETTVLCAHNSVHVFFSLVSAFHGNDIPCFAHLADDRFIQLRKDLYSKRAIRCDRKVKHNLRFNATTVAGSRQAVGEGLWRNLWASLGEAATMSAAILYCSCEDDFHIRRRKKCT
jgi:hypothetical protein